VTSRIHPTAIVAPGASLGADVSIGAFAVVGEHVTLGDGVVLHPHALVDGHTTLGAGVEVFSFAAVGTRPQDLKYRGEPTTLHVGARTIVREYATLQPGTISQHGRGRTDVGADGLIMAYAHVAHDCVVGDRVILANAAQLAGHVVVEDGAFVGGLTGVHQFVRVGARAMTGAQARVVKDVPPFCVADGHPAELQGLNVVGLRRAGFTSESIRALRRAYRALFRTPGLVRERLAAVRASGDAAVAEVEALCAFVESSARGVTRARRGAREDGDADDAE
jgi:UDP-N-acetylglucosamine acyltransferase